MQHIIKMPINLNINFESFDFAARLQDTVISLNVENIILDFSECKFCNAIFTSFLGALAHIAESSGKTITYRCKKDSNLYNYLRHSGLYNYITEDNVDYTNPNAIPFSKIDMEDDSIIDYIDNILELAPIKLTDQGYELLFKNIYEIFNNSSEHSKASMGVYGCGHWMPHKKQLVFSVYDTGIGISTLIRDKVDSSLSSEDAVKWALTRGNSTQQLTHGIPRGLGLADLFDFIKLNSGGLCIFTNDLFYHYKQREQVRSLTAPIIGTMIGMTIIADYEHIYTTK